MAGPHLPQKSAHDKSGKIKSCSLGFDTELGAALLILQINSCTHFHDTTKDEFLIDGDRCKIELPLDNTFNGIRYVHKDNKASESSTSLIPPNNIVCLLYFFL